MGQHETPAPSVTPAGATRPAPDDTEADDAIASAQDLTEALFEIAEKYEAPLTNNEPRWKDGVYLRHVGDFTADVKDQVARFADQDDKQDDKQAATSAAARAEKDAAAIKSLLWECAYWELTAIERRRFWTYSGRDWRGWPQIGSDEYHRRTLVLGLPFVGALVIALHQCRCEDCANDIKALRDIVESDD